jgi:ABC-type branched-subunit amino acid transport system substrate-binding protein
MTLVRSHLPRLSGNRYFWVLCLLLISLVSACSRKVAPVKPGNAKVPPVTEKPGSESPEGKKLDHSIALLLPFELNSINLKTARAKDISKADLAIDFYQGFKLALDSLSRNGHHYKLQVFDTQEQETRVVNLARAASVRENDLVVGPVFPDALTAFSEFSDPDPSKIIVYPLAASLPSQVKNPALLMLNNTIDQHGLKIADYITKTYQPEQVHIVLVNTRKTDDEKFAAPVRKYINELSKGKFSITERPNSIGLQSYLSTSRNNLVILSSSDRLFLTPTIDKLFQLSGQDYRIEVFGHPNWLKANFLDGSKLQTLKTKLSSSYFVDYKSPAVKHFVARYRDEYGLEPSEFAFKGFDAGYYFGRLLEKYGEKYASHITEEDYKGLHNEYRFTKDQITGYSNSNLMLLTFRGLELQQIK